MTGDNHTPTMNIDAKLYGPSLYGKSPSREQLQSMLQALLECICLNNTKNAVHQARESLGHCLTATQLLAYPFDQTETQVPDGEEGKRKLSKVAQQAKTHSSKNITPLPKSEQSQGQPKRPVPNKANSQAVLPQDNTPVELDYKNSAPLPKIDQLPKQLFSIQQLAKQRCHRPARLLSWILKIARHCPKQTSHSKRLFSIQQLAKQCYHRPTRLLSWILKIAHHYPK